jgi:predicted O-methyltransferase YrrM
MNETMPDGTRDTWAEFERNTAGIRHRLRVVRKRSEDLTAEDVGGELSLVFIDGDHSYEAAKADFDRVVCWLAEDGTVAFHDVTNFRGVSRVVGEALVSGEWILDGISTSLVWLKRARWTANGIRS